MSKQFKLSLAVLVIAAAVPTAVLAEFNQSSHLNARGQSKVNKAMAKGYAQEGVEGMQKNQSQVNIGSKRAGNCTMNVGATPAGQKNPKEVIVTSREIINICK